MMPAGLANDDFFDFSEQIFGESKPNLNEQKDKTVTELTLENEVHTSYVLVNALLNLLIQKGYIHSYEVSEIVAELHQQFIKRKKG